MIYSTRQVRGPPPRAVAVHHLTSSLISHLSHLALIYLFFLVPCAVPCFSLGYTFRLLPPPPAIPADRLHNSPFMRPQIVQVVSSIPTVLLRHLIRSGAA